MAKKSSPRVGRNLPYFEIPRLPNRLYDCRVTSGTNGFGFPAHRHDEIEIASIPAGLRGCVAVDGQLHPVEGGCFLYIGPQKAHSFDIRFTGQKHFTTLLINRRTLVQSLAGFLGCSTATVAQQLASIPVVHRVNAHLLDRLVSRMSLVKVKRNEPRGTQSPVAVAADDVALVYQMIGLMLRESEAVQRAERDVAAQRIIDTVQEHFLEPLNLDAIAWKCNMSKYHACRVFKRHTGQTIHAYVNQLRIRQAKVLLEQRAKRVTQVSLESGFSSVGRFCRLFRRHTGVSPASGRACRSRSWKPWRS